MLAMAQKGPRREHNTMFDDETLNGRDGDAVIIERFAEWRRIELAGRGPSDRTDDDIARDSDREMDLARAIMELPATGIVGLTSKLALAAHYNEARHSIPIGGIDGDAWAALIEDAVRLCSDAVPVRDCLVAMLPAETPDDGAAQSDDDPPLSLDALKAQYNAVLPELGELVRGQDVDPKAVQALHDRRDRIAEQIRRICPPLTQDEIAELWRRARALVAECEAPLPAGDAGLAEALARALRVRAARHALTEEFELHLPGRVSDDIEDQVNESICQATDRLEDLVSITAPMTAVGVAAKLRQLLDPDTGMFECGIGEGVDENSLRQILDFAEREAAARGGA
jgi:hypothetical protein